MTSTAISELRTALETASSDSERLAAMLALAWPTGIKDPQEALALASDSHTIATQLEDRPAIAESLFLMGVSSNKLSDYQRARDHLEDAHALFKELEHRGGLARALGNLGSVYHNLGLYANAIENFESARTLAEELGDRQGVAYCMVNVGQVYCDIGDYAKALEYFLSALALSEELDDDRGVTTCLSNLGNVYRDIGDYAKALEYLRLAHSLSERLGIRQAIAADTGNIGSVYHDLGQYSQALEYMQLARTAYEQLGDKKGVAGVTGNIGIVYRDMGNYDDAMEYHQMSLRLAVEIGDRTMIALVTGNIGHLIAIEVFDGYNPSYAQKLLQRAIDLTIEIGNKSLLLDPYRWLAGLYQQQGKWEQAYQYLSYYHEVKEDVQGHKVHKQAQQIEHLKQIAAMEKQRVIEQSKAKAIQEVQRMKAEQVEKELGNTTLQLLAQTELLRELRSDLQKIARKIPPSEPVARELRDRIKNLPCDAVDWKKFDAQFAIAHPEFVRNLTARAPDLTVTEVRVCTMVRMNLKSHEIASLFCITDAGVEFHRRNIRRKLQLKKVEKLPLVLGAM